MVKHVDDVILEVYALANKVFENEKNASEWMSQPIIALGNRRPKDMMENPNDIAMVLEVLCKIKDGEFT